MFTYLLFPVTDWLEILFPAFVNEYGINLEAFGLFQESLNRPLDDLLRANFWPIVDYLLTRNSDTAKLREVLDYWGNSSVTDCLEVCSYLIWFFFYIYV
jgi:hypothetical protein